MQMEWSQPQIQGDLVSPRAGHAGISVDEMWYIVGGGDNRNGTCDVIFHLILFMLGFLISCAISLLSLQGAWRLLP